MLLYIDASRATWPVGVLPWTGRQLMFWQEEQLLSEAMRAETTVTPSMHLAKHEPGANHDLDRKAQGDQAPEPIPN